MTDPLMATIAGAKESDRAFLRRCRAHNLTLGRTDVVAAVDQRLRDLDLSRAVGIRPEINTLEERVTESLRVYRAILKHRHGRNQAAGYTEREIRQKGARQALIDTVMRGKDTDGLKALAAFDRLDCSYEQIAVDFAGTEELPNEVVLKALETLDRFREEGDDEPEAR